MTTFRRSLGLAGATGLALAAAVAASPVASAATTGHRDDDRGAVFVQNDALTGNQVYAYHRGADGALTQVAGYATGGVGGRLDGAGVDFTASQGALAADRANDELYAVNAGSDSLSVFGVRGDRLTLRQVVGTEGTFPVSVTAHDDRVFVLNARHGGSIQGYLNVGGRLLRVPSWHRELRLPVTTGAAEFTHTPGQVAFTPDGRHLVVTTKAASNSIEVFGLGRSGRLTADPVVRAENGTVPFAVTFDAPGHLAVTSTGLNAVSTYAVGASGALTPLGVTPTGQRATCWIDASGNLLAASNAGSGTVTTLRADAAGTTTKLADIATSAGGTVDADFTRDGRYLYVQTGANGGVDTFAVGADGTLTAAGSVTVPNGTGGEGIVAW
jgi:6-phosphogluconolactonase (cycloisomerase 2 family)